MSNADAWRDIAQALMYAVLTADITPEQKEDIFITTLKQSPKVQSGEADLEWEKFLIGQAVRDEGV